MGLSPKGQTHFKRTAVRPPPPPQPPNTHTFISILPFNKLENLVEQNHLLEFRTFNIEVVGWKPIWWVTAWFGVSLTIRHLKPAIIPRDDVLLPSNNSPELKRIEFQLQKVVIQALHSSTYSKYISSPDTLECRLPKYRTDLYWTSSNFVSHLQKHRVLFQSACTLL